MPGLAEPRQQPQAMATYPTPSPPLVPSLPCCWWPGRDWRKGRPVTANEDLRFWLTPLTLTVAFPNTKEKWVASPGHLFPLSLLSSLTCCFCNFNCAYMHTTTLFSRHTGKRGGARTQAGPGPAAAGSPGSIHRFPSRMPQTHPLTWLPCLIFLPLVPEASLAKTLSLSSQSGEKEVDLTSERSAIPAQTWQPCAWHSMPCQAAGVLHPAFQVSAHSVQTLGGAAMSRTGAGLETVPRLLPPPSSLLPQRFAVRQAVAGRGQSHLPFHQPTG